MSDAKNQEVKSTAGSQGGIPSFDFGAIFLLGAFFGAGMALLLTPKPSLRKEVKKTGDRLRKDALKTGGELLEDAEQRIETLGEELSAAVEDGVRTIRAAVAEEVEGIEKRLSRRKKKRRRPFS